MGIHVVTCSTHTYINSIGKVHGHPMKTVSLCPRLGENSWVGKEKESTVSVCVCVCVNVQCSPVIQNDIFVLFL